MVEYFFRTPFNYDREAVSHETGLVCEAETLCQQHMAEECDIQTIVRRFNLTGQLPVGLRAPAYGDYTGIDDYRSALDMVKAAQENFMEMPAEVRARFDHDPQLFLEFCSDPRNADEMRRLGLVVDKAKEVAATPAAAPAAP